MDGMSAKTRYLRQSPRKVRLVASLIRGMGVSDALAQLSAVTKAARAPVEKTLRSAVANAENNFQQQRDRLFIKEIRVDEGPDMRRWRPRAFGRAAPILKHSCHISIQLGSSARAAAEDAAPRLPEESGMPVRLPEADPEQSAVPPSKEIFDTSRTGRHETAQIANKEQKKSRGFMKKIFQRKTG